MIQVEKEENHRGRDKKIHSKSIQNSYCCFILDDLIYNKALKAWKYADICFRG